VEVVVIIHGRNDGHVFLPWTVSLFLEKKDDKQRRHCDRGVAVLVAAGRDTETHGGVARVSLVH